MLRLLAFASQSVAALYEWPHLAPLRQQPQRVEKKGNVVEAAPHILVRPTFALLMLLLHSYEPTKQSAQAEQESGAEQ